MDRKRQLEFGDRDLSLQLLSGFLKHTMDQKKQNLQKLTAELECLSQDLDLVVKLTGSKTSFDAQIEILDSNYRNSSPRAGTAQVPETPLSLRPCIPLETNSTMTPSVPLENSETRGRKRTFTVRFSIDSYLMQMIRKLNPILLLHQQVDSLQIRS